MTTTDSSSSADILQQLQEGNRRFAAGKSQTKPALPPTANTQSPCAIVLGCSDSRVPVETIFDQAIGSLFVVRVAGNIATPTQIGSIEFAAVKFAVPLVIVLGHTHCGAITTTLESLANADASAAESPESSFNLAAITGHIKPILSPLLQNPDLTNNPEALHTAAVHANIHASCAALQSQSNILKNLVTTNHLAIHPAEYDLTTHQVRFLSPQ